jgi:hypothetical protein
VQLVNLMLTSLWVSFVISDVLVEMGISTVDLGNRESEVL